MGGREARTELQAERERHLGIGGRQDVDWIQQAVGPVAGTCQDMNHWVPLKGGEFHDQLIHCHLLESYEFAL
jgi:hypothetical protein